MAVKKTLFLLATIVMIGSCKKDTKAADPAPEPPSGAGTVKVSFNAMVDSLPLVFGDSYLNENGDTFTVSKFKYFISNVVLTASDGSKYTEAESYHLMDHANTGKQSFIMSNVPKGTYKSMSYMIGVDSARNTSGAQENDLSPSLDMYWGWLTGYIMLKFEGSSPQSGNFNQGLFFHIGGYYDPYNAVKTCSLTFGQDLIVNVDKSPQVKLKTNVNELFRNPTTLDFLSNYDITSKGLRANAFANNYANMITYETIIP